MVNDKMQSPWYVQALCVRTVVDKMQAPWVMCLDIICNVLSDEISEERLRRRREHDRD